MLRQKKTYLEISEKTGASTATISRVNRSLIYGNDGYELVFERLGQEEEERKNEVRFSYWCCQPAPDRPSGK